MSQVSTLYLNNDAAPSSISHLPSGYLSGTSGGTVWTQTQTNYAGSSAKNASETTNSLQTTYSKTWTQINKNATSTLGFVQYLSKPLTAQTIGSGSWTIGYGNDCTSDNGISNYAGKVFIGLVNGSTGQLRSNIATLVTFGASRGQTTTENSLYSTTVSGSSVTATAGDYIVIEIGLTVTAGISATTPTADVYSNGSTAITADNTSPISDAQGAITFPAAITFQDFYTGSGGIQLSGQTIIQGPKDPIQLSGSASVLPTYLYSGAGNLAIIGTAITSHPFLGGGILLFSNSAPAKLSYAVMGSGSISTAGTASEKVSAAFTAAGNIRIAGAASYQRLLISISYAGSGSIKLGAPDYILSSQAACICRRQYATGSSSSTNTVSVTLPVSTITGSCLVAFIGCDNINQTLSSAPTGFTQAIEQTTINAYSTMFYATNAASASGTLTWTFNLTADSFTIILLELQGLLFYETSISNVKQGASGSVSTLNISASQFNAYLIGNIFVNNGNVIFSSPKNNFRQITQVQETSLNLASSVVDDNLVAIQTSYSTGNNISQSGNAIGIIADFLLIPVSYPPQAATGGIVFGQTTADVSCSVWAYTAVGGIAFSRGASQFLDITLVGAGGIAVVGSAVVKFNQTMVASGKLILAGGAIPISTNYHALPSGNIRLFGTASYRPTYLYNGSGSIKLSGNATTNSIQYVRGQGGIDLSGAITVNPTYISYTASGKIRIGNSFLAQRKYIFAPSGKITIVGAAGQALSFTRNMSGFLRLSKPTNYFFTQAGGKLTLKGTGVSHPVFNRTGNNGLRLSGAARTNSIIKPTGSGGLRISGTNTNKVSIAPYRASGNIRLSGTSAKIFKARFIATGAGKLTIKGSATSIYKFALFNYSGSGNIRLSGAWNKHLTIPYISGGKEIITGSATTTATKFYATASGGIETSNMAVIPLSFEFDEYTIPYEPFSYFVEQP